MKEVYLDNSATTKVLPEVVELMSKIMLEDYGNPSSMHTKGIESEKYLREATETLSKILKVSEKEIYYTSCGTESDNTALIGAAHANMRNGMHLITTKIEHPAILNTMKQLEEEGFRVTYLDVNDTGVISLEDLKNAITDNTILVSIMHVNNEIGSVQPIEEAGELIKSINPKILFHVDAVQSFGKLPIIPKKMHIDMLSISGHKIHGPKGVGVLYINEKAKVKPLILGGGQQNGMRSGTENVPGIVGLALAAKTLNSNLSEDTMKLWELKKYFIEEVTKIPDVTVNGLPLSTATNKLPAADDATGNIGVSDAVKVYGAPHIVSVSVKDVRSEVLLHSLEAKGVYVSAGSACSTHKREPSKTLVAIGLDPKLYESTIRFSMSIFTTKEDIDIALEAMREIIPTLRKYTRR